MARFWQLLSKQIIFAVFFTLPVSKSSATTSWRTTTDSINRAAENRFRAYFQKKWGKNAFFLKKVLRKRKFALSLHSQSGKTERRNASLAQLVEHDTLNVGVQGSSPWGGTEEKNESSSLFSLYTFTINNLTHRGCTGLCGRLPLFGLTEKFRWGEL